ncbi:MAG: GNAT family N-acetyltransferase [Candidatus Dormibacteraeota bacterium]|uniref:GNAT family N-acetyltransferase n=1 Tax=Candidatus Aeolococcus gillhamiae TaxID=3127015 RepID=A0A934JX59_9BACT|nr:GNAT family N-acetyltransferase [Candidatus Dormibacteraeota bacterium]
MAGKGVFLRRSAPIDVGLLIEASRDAEIIHWTRTPQNLDYTAASDRLGRWQDRVTDGSLRQYVISRGAKDPPVGLTSLILQEATDPWCADVVYWLLPRGRHLGLVTGAVTLLLRWAFDETALRRAVLYTLEGNEPSEGVAKRCGFRFDRLVDDTREGRPLRLNRWELTSRWRNEQGSPGRPS